jgi:tRNA pseudouridine32 synthase/23S rRNA pseudouridine746 synthase
MTPEELRTRVLHEDPDLFVIDKPAGLAVHKAGKITDHLELYLPALADVDGVAPRLAHRLDLDTAGCLILGRTDWALKRLGRLFAGGTVDKSYWAVCEGIPAEPAGTIALSLLKLSSPGSWNIVTGHPDGQPAVTDYRLLGTGGGLSWLELRPRTGRTHQIRVHCAAIGCPLVGEPFYGPERRLRGNLHLLARSLSFRLSPDHPAVTAVAPPPPHMRDALAACGWNG